MAAMDVSGSCSAILARIQDDEAREAALALQHSHDGGPTYQLVGWYAYAEEPGCWLNIRDYPGAWDLPLAFKIYAPVSVLP